jgi:hypothetical protein
MLWASPHKESAGSAEDYHLLEAYKLYEEQLNSAISEAGPAQITPKPQLLILILF